MALRFLLGRAGSGKSQRCYREIAVLAKAAPFGPPLLLLVPDQASFTAEWELAHQPGVSGSLRARASSLQKLYRELLAQSGQQPLPWLDDLGKAMVINQCVSRRQAEFGLFGRTSKHRGFIDSLVTMVDELQRYQITPQALQAAQEQLTTPMLKSKLKDLALVYADYCALLDGNYCDEALALEHLARLVPASPWLRGAEIWLDGFTEFNPAQRNVVFALLQSARQVTVALCLDPVATGQPGGVFDNLNKTYRRLLDFALQNGIAVEIEQLKENHRHRQSPVLATVEQAFSDKQFRRYSQDWSAAELNKSLRVGAAATPGEEVAWAAKEIFRLCREEGYRFADLAVVTRSLADYQQEIVSVFEEYGVPCFADIAKPLQNHPLLELLQSALEVLAEDWQNPSVLRYLKTGLNGLAPEEIDRLENYALANGIRSSQWRKAGSWQKYNDATQGQYAAKPTPEEKQQALSEINAIGLAAVGPLLHFCSGLKKQGKQIKVAAYVAACRALLQQLAAAEQLQTWADEAQLAGDLETAAAHRQIFEQVEGLLEQLNDFLGSNLVSPQQMAELLAEGGKNLGLASIPPAVDEVVVADINRSRLPNVKVAFVLGCNEGVFPLRMAEDSLLDSLEREELKAIGLELAASQREQQFAEDYHIYMALTRSTEKLYLSFAAHSNGGEERKPSVLLASLRFLFPRLQYEDTAAYPVAQALIDSNLLLADLEGQLLAAKEGQNIAGIWWQVLADYQQSGRRGPELAAIRQGLQLCKDSSSLDLGLWNALYPNPGVTSVSRLELFNNCPCKYYARYGLGLAPRTEYQVRPLDVGLIYHYILAEVLQDLAAQEPDWDALDEAQLLPRIEAALEEFLAQGLAGVFAESNKNQYMKQKIIRVVCQCLLDIAGQLALGNFRPVSVELAFGREQGGPAWQLTLGDGKQIEVRGQIDRVDKASAPGCDYYRIIDYKMANKQLKVADIYYGLNWQLPVYLQALLNIQSKQGGKGKTAAPAGMFYIPVREVVNSVRQPSSGSSGPAKLKGLAILDLEAVALAENQLPETGGSAQTMSLRLKKDGSFAKGNGGITPRQYQLLQQHIEGAMKQQLENLQAGCIQQLPVSVGGTPICQYCEFSGLCAVDNALQPESREVKPLSNQQVFAALGETEEQEVAADAPMD